MVKIADVFGKTFGGSDSDSNPGDRNSDPNDNDHNSSNDRNNDDNKKKKDRSAWKEQRRLYRKITEKYIFKTFKEERNPEILWYDELAGVYRFGGEVKIKEEIEKLWQAASNEDILNEELHSDSNGNNDPDSDSDSDSDPETELDNEYANPISEHERNELVKLICWNNLVSRDEFDANEDLINVKNGLLNVHTRQIKPHTSNYLSLKQMPINYNPAAKPKKILRVLSQILDKKNLSLLIRYLGYILLTKSTIYQKALMFLGYGANGKSVVLSLIEHMVGLENCSHVKLQDLGKNKFMVAELFGKYVNTYADIPASEIIDTSSFKTAVTGDRILGEKKFHDPFQFDNQSKLIYSTNEIPRTFDTSYGFYRRWLIILFNRLFEGDNRDEHLITKLVNNETEMSGLLNLALVGLEKLIKEKGFEDKPIEVMRKEFEYVSMTVREFLSEHCHAVYKDGPNEHYLIDKEEFIAAYNSFCRSKDPPEAPMPEGRLDNELLKYDILPHRAVRNGRKKQFLRGVITKVVYERELREGQYKAGQTTL